MKVGELIEALRQMPVEADVRLVDWNEHYNVPFPLTDVTLTDGAVLLDSSADFPD